MTERHFVILCANQRDRDEVRRVGLQVYGYDRVHLLILGTAIDALRGLIIDGWAISEWADRDLRAGKVVPMLRVRTRPVGDPQ